MKRLFFLLLILPLSAMADSYSDYYQKRDSKRILELRDNTSNLKEELKDAYASPEMLDEEGLKKIELEPKKEETEETALLKSQKKDMDLTQQIDLNMSLREAAEAGKKLKEKRRQEQDQ